MEQSTTQSGMTKAWADVCNERARQVFKGYTAAHDDEHDVEDLSEAAISYMMRAAHRPLGAQDYWPFIGDMPSRTAGETERDDLVKAAAMALAAIERFDRKQEREGAHETD